MRFLYAGELPCQKTIKDKKIFKYEEPCFGSDVTPEKEEHPHHLNFPSKENSEKGSGKFVNEKEEEKEIINVESGVQSKISIFKKDNIQSEQQYDINNPLNSRMSERVNRDTVRSQTQGVLDDEKRTDGENQLENMYKQFEQDQRRESNENLEVVHEVISRKSSKSIVSEVVVSSDQSVAAPPISEGSSEPNVVFQGKFKCLYYFSCVKQKWRRERV